MINRGDDGGDEDDGGGMDWYCHRSGADIVGGDGGAAVGGRDNGREGIVTG